MGCAQRVQRRGVRGGGAALGPDLAHDFPCGVVVTQRRPEDERADRSNNLLLLCSAPGVDADLVVAREATNVVDLYSADGLGTNWSLQSAFCFQIETFRSSHLFSCSPA